MKRTFASSYTSMLIIINVVAYIFALIFIGIFGADFLFFLAIVPNLFFQGYIWTAFTSMFLHDFSGIISFHLLANMVSLFFVGIFTERLIGKKRFLGIYLFSGIFAAIFYATLAYFFGYGIGARLFGSPDTLALGASGAIFGLIGVIAILTPRNRIYLIAGPLIAIIIQTILASAFPTAAIISFLNIIITFYFIFSIYSMFSFNPNLRRYALPIELPFYLLPIIAIVPLVIISFFIDLPIGNSAHLGGLLAGLGYGYYLKRKYPRKTQMISQYFSR
jgi:membrane associated rhomboid family serine protease